MAEDYYAVLGVAPNASEEEIRRAYRKLAMRYHPDHVLSRDAAERKASEDRFKEVQEAYDALISKPQRSFGFPRTRSRSVIKGRDIFLNISLSKQEAVAGVEKIVSFRREEPCPTCGKYIDSIAFLALYLSYGLHCPKCRGLGTVRINKKLAVTIPPGLADGQYVKLAGQGRRDYSFMVAGNVILRVKIKKHPFYIFWKRGG